jgi:hypothetical protein
MRRNLELEATIRAKYIALEGVLNEKTRRLWAATESSAIGYGGDAVIASATGLARATIRTGREELKKGKAVTVHQRRPGGGRKRLALIEGGWVEALERMVAPATRGDPMSPLRWTCKSTRNLTTPAS